MSVRTNRDWHRLVGVHSLDCLLQDFEPYHAATPQDREHLVAAWNRRHEMPKSMVYRLATQMGWSPTSTPKQGEGE
jgi:hypothetical protein